MKFNRKFLIFLLPLLMLAVLHLFGAKILSDANKTWMQIIFYPLVVLSTAQYLVSGFNVPRSIFIISAAFAFLGVGYAYMYPLNALRGGLVIARLEGDELQYETRIFRERINHALTRHTTIKALSIDEDFSNLAEAESFISNNRKLQILISGSKKWVNIFFPEREPETLGSLGLKPDLPAISGLEVHYSVRTVGLSLQPARPTAAFIAHLAEGVINYKDRKRNNSFELSLLEAIGENAFWTSFSHKAYPFWFLGNYYLESSAGKTSLKRPVLNCAIRSYRRGFELLRSGDNPDLRASILNNLGVAVNLRGYLLGKKKDLKIAQKYYSMSLKVYREKSKLAANFSAAESALKNLMLLTSTKYKFKKSKRKKAKKAEKLKKHKKKKKDA